MLKKSLLTSIISSSVLFGSSFASADFVDDLGDIGTVFIDCCLFVWSFVKFIIFGLKTILNLTWKAFDYIFNDTLFNGILDVFRNLVYYMGSPSALAFLSLFFTAVLLMFMSFVLRHLRGKVSYDSALRKIQKHK